MFTSPFFFIFPSCVSKKTFLYAWTRKLESLYTLVYCVLKGVADNSRFVILKSFDVTLPYITGSQDLITCRITSAVYVFYKDFPSYTSDETPLSLVVVVYMGNIPRIHTTTYTHIHIRGCVCIYIKVSRLIELFHTRFTLVSVYFTFL